MCLAIPLRVMEINANKAKLEAAGVVAEADISLVEGVEIGDYLLVHAGFALTKVAPDEAEETLALYREILAAGEGA